MENQIKQIATEKIKTTLCALEALGLHPNEVNFIRKSMWGLFDAIIENNKGKVQNDKKNFKK